MFLVEADESWYDLVRIHKAPDGPGSREEDEEECEVLDPAPLEQLPQPRAVGQALLWVPQTGRHCELVTAGPRRPQAEVVGQVDCEISKQR